MSNHTDPQSESTPRGDDDRKNTVNPADNPAPSSPAPEPDAVREGEDKLERVKPY